MLKLTLKIPAELANKLHIARQEWGTEVNDIRKRLEHLAESQRNSTGGTISQELLDATQASRSAHMVTSALQDTLLDLQNRFTALESAVATTVRSSIAFEDY